jgi:superfamily II DNA or RNA helicase
MTVLSREEAQKKAVDLINMYNNIILSWATGIGKSLAFIKIQEAINSKKTYIVVSETAHIDNWIKEYKKYNKEYLLESTKIFCYASLHKYAVDDLDLLCLDEGHHSTTDIRIELLSKVKSKKIVVLSATLTDDNKYLLKNLYGDFYEYNIELKHAINSNLLPEPEILLCELQLDDSNITEEIQVERGKKKERVPINCTFKDIYKYLKITDYPNISLKAQCTQKQKILFLQNEAEYYEKRYYYTNQEFFKIKWLKKHLEIKKSLAEFKTPYIKQIIPYIENMRYICFCGSIEQAEKLSNNTIHSKKDSPLKVLDAFNNKEINNIFVINMLQEGMNLIDLEFGIIIQLDGTIRSFIQKIGRSLRSEYPKILIFYYNYEKDIGYLNKALLNLEEKYIKKVEFSKLKEIL